MHHKMSMYIDYIDRADEILSKNCRILKDPCISDARGILDISRDILFLFDIEYGHMEDLVKKYVKKKNKKIRSLDNIRRCEFISTQDLVDYIRVKSDELDKKFEDLRNSKDMKC